MYRYELDNYYQYQYDNNGRLQKDKIHRIDVLATVSYFEKLLPVNSKVLDACARTALCLFSSRKRSKNIAWDLIPYNVKQVKTSTTKKP